jgi:hypothetical protein
MGLIGPSVRGFLCFPNVLYEEFSRLVLNLLEIAKAGYSRK